MRSRHTRLAGVILGATVAGALALLATSGGSRAQQADGAGAPPVVGQARPVTPYQHIRPSRSQVTGLSKIKHFVFIIKENRSFDDMFGTFPGANGATTGVTSLGQVLTLQHESDKIARDLDHSWTYSIQGVDSGKMDKWDLDVFPPLPCNVNGDYLCYSQLYQSDIPNYWTYAQTYTLGDHMFASINGPSFPNHLYTVAAQANGVVTNVPAIAPPGVWGCDAPEGSSASVVLSNNLVANEYPCFDFATLVDSLQAAQISWRYYSPSFGSPGYTFNALDAINHIRNSSLWNSNIALTTQFATDAQGGMLPDVSWVVMNDDQSDHPPGSACYGEDWTVDQLNALAAGPASQWDSTAVILLWDDWGGYYDHLPPPVVDSFGFGVRVPLLIISPYAKPGYISHTTYELSSFLKLVEERYGLPALTARDAAANDMLDSFNFNQTPLAPITLTPRHCNPASTTGVTFPPQPVNTPSGGKTVYVTNYNSFVMTVSNITIDNPEFTWTNAPMAPPCLNNPLAGAGPVLGLCTLVLNFTPTATGPQTATMTITDNDSTGTQTIALSGLGTEVTLSPTLLTFPKQSVGVQGAAMNATLTNSGTTAVTINSVVASGDYSQTNTCGGSLAGGKSCTITVTFKPTATGTRFGTVTVTDSDAGGPQVLNLTGVGTQLSLSPTSLTFAGEPLGVPSPTQAVTLTNESGTPLTISGISATYAASIPNISVKLTGLQAQFSETNTCGNSLAIGASCAINVVFTPLQTGTITGTVTLVDSAGDSPQSVSLTGTGLPSLASGVPMISQPLVPSNASPGGAAFTLTVNGANYVPGAVVKWNGAALTTSFVSKHQLTATVPASDIAKAATAYVTVFNPAPGGGSSNSAAFSISETIPGVTFSRTDITAGTGPKAVAVGDFNGDGNQDLAVVNNAGNTVSIFTGNGSGGFTLKSTASTGLGPLAIVTGDFNGDGKLDLAVANKGANSITILLGNGDGTFNAVSQVPSTVTPLGLAVGDFNQDGKLDLLVPNGNISEMSLLLGRGDGTFEETTSPLGLGLNPMAAAVGDFNGDGIPDFVEINNGANDLTGQAGVGDGTFTASTSSAPTGSGPVAIVAGDFNGDGLLDVAVVNNLDNTVSILLGNDNLTFTAKGSPIPTGNGPVCLAVGDMNGDGKLDLVIVNSTDGTVSVLLGNGDGTFLGAETTSTGTAPSGVAIGDFNNDGKADLVTANQTANSVSVLLETATNTGPIVSFNPASLTFGSQALHTTSPAQIITLTNAGTATLTGIGISITGANSLDFAETNTCPASLNAGSNCTISVTFTPSADGTRTASVSVADNAPGSPQTVPLSGLGGGAPGVLLTPTTLTFPQQLVGTPSPSQTVTLTNDGTGTLNITAKMIQGSNPTSFTETDNCPASLMAGLSCMFTVTFIPQTKNTLTATLTITDNASGSPQVVGLTGTGTYAAVAPSSLTFAGQRVGTTSPPQTVTLTNTLKKGVFSITSITITGTDQLDFAETNNCGNSLNPGASCTINVTFTPIETGTRTATLTIVDNAGGGQQTVSLTGTGD